MNITYQQKEENRFPELYEIYFIKQEKLHLT